MYKWERLRKTNSGQYIFKEYNKSLIQNFEKYKDISGGKIPQTVMVRIGEHKSVGVHY